MAASPGPRGLFDRRLRHVIGGQPPLCQPLATDCRSTQSQFSVDYWSRLRLHWQQNERRRFGWMVGMSYNFDISRASEAKLYSQRLHRIFCTSKYQRRRTLSTKAATATRNINPPVICWSCLHPLKQLNCLLKAMWQASAV